MKGYGYITVASGAVYLQWESVLENTRILTSRKHTRRQKREWKKDSMLAQGILCKLSHNLNLAVKSLGLLPLSLFTHQPTLSSLSITPFSHCLADHRGWLPQAILIRHMRYVWKVCRVKHTALPASSHQYFLAKGVCCRLFPQHRALVT